jgi:acyl-CoA synthetase (NDP forming)
MLKQAGAIEVDSLEELVDVLLLFQEVRNWQGISVAIVGGLCGGGGGISVSAGDACSEEGLNIPALSETTRQELVNILGLVGSIVRNPVDISQAYGQPSILHKVMEVIMADANIQLVIVQEDADILTKYGCLQISDIINGVLIDFASRCSKPVVVVSPPGSAEMDRLRIENQLSQASIPVFPTMERAARAIARVNQYFSSHQGT